MPDWWTYTLSDLQAFTLDTYYRLFERYNSAIWPAHVAALVLGAAIVALLRRPGGGPARGRVVAGILAASWLWIAVAFHATRYAAIHRLGKAFAWAFGFEALLLVAVGVLGSNWRRGRRADWVGRLGLAIFVFALAVHPFVGLLFGRTWRQLEVFGVAPDPTAVATLGLSLLAGGRRRWLLLPIPVLWCAFSGATLLAMESPSGWLMVAAGAFAVGSALIRGQR
jgi:hypothetical protein